MSDIKYYGHRKRISDGILKKRHKLGVISYRNSGPICIYNDGCRTSIDVNRGQNRTGAPDKIWPNGRKHWTCIDVIGACYDLDKQEPL